MAKQSVLITGANSGIGRAAAELLASRGYRVLATMRERSRGIIINVSSLQGRIGSPLGSPYCASKHALEALSESLHYEVRHFGTRVHVIEPGTIETAFLDTRRWGSAGEKSSHYQPLIEQWTQGFAKLQDELGRAEPSLAAEAILNAIEKGDKFRYPVGADAEMVFLARKQLDDETFESTMRQQLGLTW